MALSASTVWEIRTTGAANNGGGFVTGSSGTDWSQQDSAQYSVTDAVTAGTTTITSVSANFGTDVVGNILYIQGGTGSITQGWYQIISRTNSTTIVVDRSTGLAAGTGATLKIGGAISSIAAVTALMSVAGMIAYVKATATYSISTGINVGSASDNSNQTRIVGYTTTRGDLGRPVIQTTAAVTALTIGSAGWCVENLEIDGNSTGTIGINVTTGRTGTIYNCRVRRCTSEGIKSNSGSGIVAYCEVTACAGSGGIYDTGGLLVYSCWVHDCTVNGIFMDVSGARVEKCVVTNNTGASSDGVTSSGFDFQVIGCSIYGNGRHGINHRNQYGGMSLNWNNILVSNGGYGISAPSTTQHPFRSDGNAFYNNTSGARQNVNAGAHDVTLTGDPFTNAGSNDYTLNDTAGAGAACKSVALPSGLLPPNLTGATYDDIGFFRHQDPVQGPVGKACL